MKLPTKLWILVFSCSLTACSLFLSPEEREQRKAEQKQELIENRIITSKDVPDGLVHECVEKWAKDCVANHGNCTERNPQQCIVYNIRGRALDPALSISVYCSSKAELNFQQLMAKHDKLMGQHKFSEAKTLLNSSGYEKDLNECNDRELTQYQINAVRNEAAEARATATQANIEAARARKAAQEANQATCMMAGLNCDNWWDGTYR